MAGDCPLAGLGLGQVLPAWNGIKRSRSCTCFVSLMTAMKTAFVIHPIRPHAVDMR